MEKNLHTLGELFSQLGLPCDTVSIESFIAHHRPLDGTIKLSDAPFWNQSQRDFLQQQICVDADWSEWVDKLDVRLR
jgi:hypothetical protein